MSGVWFGNGGALLWLCKECHVSPLVSAFPIRHECNLLCFSSTEDFDSIRDESPVNDVVMYLLIGSGSDLGLVPAGIVRTVRISLIVLPLFR